ncbi:MAG: thioredoxin family protein [Flavobacteriaceae bacterium]|nr:thioredoxin family protein [Flavobacteriaceae bacterium]
MKNILKLLFLFTFLLSLHANAQITKVDDWETAQNEAISQNKNILIILTGSEWCKPCIKMEKNVIETSDFENYANNNLILFEINLPRHQDLNSKIYKDYNYFKNKYQTNALPSLILVESDGKKIAKMTNGVTSKEKVLNMLIQNDTVLRNL